MIRFKRKNGKFSSQIMEGRLCYMRIGVILPTGSKDT